MNEGVEKAKSEEYQFRLAAGIEKSVAALNTACIETADSISKYLRDADAVSEDDKRCLRALLNDSQHVSDFISNFKMSMEMMRFIHCQDYARACLELPMKQLSEELARALSRPSKEGMLSILKRFIGCSEQDMYSNKYSLNLHYNFSNLSFSCTPKSRSEDSFLLVGIYHDNSKSSAESVKICRRDFEEILSANNGLLSGYDEDALRKLISSNYEFFEELLMAQAMWEARL